MSDISFSSLSATLADVVAAAAPSVVAIHSHRALSSGFAWRPDLVVTADEALADDGEIAVTMPGGERRKAVVVGRDPTTDIALLRLENAGLPPVALETKPLRAGGPGPGGRGRRRRAAGGLRSRRGRGPGGGTRCAAATSRPGSNSISSSESRPRAPSCSTRPGTVSAWRSTGRAGAPS